MKYYSPIPELDHLAKVTPQNPFQAKTKEQAEQWHQLVRQTLQNTVGFVDEPQQEPQIEILAEVDHGNFVQRKIVLRTAPYARMPVYILLPKKAAPLPAVLAYHGHGPGVREIVGLDEQGKPRQTPADYQQDFALELVQRGFVVAAPEISCFGERQEDHSGLPEELRPTTCHHAATYAMMLGKSILGLRLRDSLRLVDYLQTLSEVDPQRIGVMGISGGGMLGFFHSALDERIKAIVLSGYFGNFRDNILALHHCACNFVPGLLQIGEFEDLIGLLAPRPLLVEAGKRDPIFPIDSVRACFQHTQEVYRIFGADPQERLYLDEFDGGHEISGRQSYDFLLHQLS